jgi:hypothetical protein
MNTRARIGRRIVTPALSAVGALLVAGVAAATISDLTAFIQRAEKMTQLNRPVRADVRVTRPGGALDAVIVFADPEKKKVFVAARSDGFRALHALDWSAGKSVTTAAPKPASHGADDEMGEIGLRAMDFFPAWATDYSTAFISDESKMEKTVTIYGKERSPYSLFVVTFDKERLVPLITKYYRERFNNLVRLRKDGDHVLVGARPRPQKISVTDYVENSTVEYEIDWSEVDAVPADLFDDAKFATATVPWPAVTASAKP